MENKKIEEIINKHIKYIKYITLPDLVELTGIEYTTLLNYCIKNNIEYKKIQPIITPEIEKVIIENAKDMTLTQLAKLTKIKYSTLLEYCRRHNIEYKRRHNG